MTFPLVWFENQRTLISMAGVRLEVFWSPNSPDKFLTWGSDISLYQVENVSISEDVAPTQSKFIYYYLFIMIKICCLSCY